MREQAMPYALFEDKTKLSRDYPTYEDAWRHAEEAGLTDMVGDKQILADGYVIEPCAGESADTQTASQWTLPSRVN
jgi:hypothetical protein